jgi:hypothetical protein
MTSQEFRKLALSLPETEERSHMKHPDFRVMGKIFATMGYPDKTRAMVKVTPVEQEMLVEAEPKVFTPVNGAWGRQGCTSVNLKAAKKTALRGALMAAWQLAAPKSIAERFPRAGALSVKAANGKNAGVARPRAKKSAKISGARKHK